MKEFEERQGSTQRQRNCNLIVNSDEYCPNCDNHFLIDAVTPKAALKVESEDTRIDARYVCMSLSKRDLGTDKSKDDKG